MNWRIGRRLPDGSTRHDLRPTRVPGVQPGKRRSPRGGKAEHGSAQRDLVSYAERLSEFVYLREMPPMPAPMTAILALSMTPKAGAAGRLQLKYQPYLIE